MANECSYDMKIRGNKRAINRVIKCLKTDYAYSTGIKPKHKHFFRVFSVYDEDDFQDNGDGTFTKFVFGTCAWSVNSCMTSSGYYVQVKGDHKDIFMGTTLEEQSKDCEIEVFSEETGMEFSEHYHYKNGVCLDDSCVDIEEGGYDENGKTTTDIDWDNYDGDYIVFNANRRGVDEEFAWTI